MKSRRYKVWFRNRDQGQLNDVVESVEAVSMKAAQDWGKSIAAERGWWFMEVRCE
jgi:hypothetical protein